MYEGQSDSDSTAETGQGIDTNKLMDELESHKKIVNTIRNSLSYQIGSLIIEWRGKPLALRCDNGP